MSLEEMLRSGLTQLHLELSDGQVHKLLGYVDLISKWNKVYNLTAVREPREMVSHHVLDCLAIVGPLRSRLQGRAAAVMDVGAGAGLPGVVLAICCAELRVDCVDTVAKKAAFVQQAGVTLAIPNLRGIHARVENLAGPYDVVTSRAFASLSDFVNWSDGALGQDGLWLAMKGKHPEAELATLPSGVKVFHVEQLQVPFLEAERCLVWIKREAETR